MIFRTVILLLTLAYIPKVFSLENELVGIVSDFKEYTIVSPEDGLINYFSERRYIPVGHKIFVIESYTSRAKILSLKKDYLESKYFLREFKAHNTVDTLGRNNINSEYYSFSIGDEKKDLLTEYMDISYKILQEYKLDENRTVETSCNLLLKEKLTFQGAFVEKGAPVVIGACLDELKFVTTISRKKLLTLIKELDITKGTIRANVSVGDLTVSVVVKDYDFESTSTNYKLTLILKSSSSIDDSYRLRVLSKINSSVNFSFVGKNSEN